MRANFNFVQSVRASAQKCWMMREVKVAVEHKVPGQARAAANVGWEIDAIIASLIAIRSK